MALLTAAVYEEKFSMDISALVIRLPAKILDFRVISTSCSELKFQQSTWQASDVFRII